MPKLPRGIYKRTYSTKRGQAIKFFGSVWDPRQTKHSIQGHVTA